MSKPTHDEIEAVYRTRLGAQDPIWSALYTLMVTVYRWGPGHAASAEEWVRLRRVAAEWGPHYGPGVTEPIAQLLARVEPVLRS